jgi:hypothetical protein
MKRRLDAARVGASVVLVAAGAAFGQVEIEERPRMPYRPHPEPVLVSAPFRFPAGNFQTQVNVDAHGMNVLGDAANEPSMAVDPTAPNRIVIGWRQFDTVLSDFRQAGHAYSVDGGRHWVNLPVLTPGVFRSDPSLRPDSAGNAYYCSLEASFATDIFATADGGRTFSGPFPSRGGDKQWLAIDRTGLASDGVEYEHWSGGFSRSFDHGMTWSLPMGGTPSGGNSAVGPDGTLFVAGAGSSVARSVNAWNPAVTPSFSIIPVSFGGGWVFGGAPNPGGGAGQGWVDVDRSSGPRHGWVYTLCSVSNAVESMDVMFNRSTDGGMTWLATPIRVNNDTPAPNSWHWFGTMGVAPNGRIDVVWNDTRESQNYRLSRLYYAYSNDGGTTWLGNVALGPQWDSWVGWPQQDKIGDYYDITSDDVGAFVSYAATYNGEQDVYFLRINDWDCNGNGVADSVDLAMGTLHDCDGNGVPDECEIAAGVQVPCACYANCDGSTAPPVLNVGDFICFEERFAAGDLYANCDGSTTPPVLSIEDFLCFQQRFAAGCR